MARVIWRRDTAENLGKITAHIEQDDPSAAANIGRRLVGPADGLTYFSQGGGRAQDGLREMVTVAPSVLSYRAEGETAFIERVRHGRQRPLG